MINILNVILAGTWLLSYAPADPPPQLCDTLSDMVSATEQQSAVLSSALVYPSTGNPSPTDQDIQDWANGLRQDIDQLTKLDSSGQFNHAYLNDLADDSQEIVYLYQYAEAAPPFTGKDPPPLWITRYNEVAYETEMIIHIFESTCPAAAAKPRHPTPPRTTPTTTPKPPPAADIIDNTPIADKLLKPDELASIVDDTDMTEKGNYTKLHLRTQGVDPPDCAARIQPGNTFPYYGPGPTATAGDLTVGAHTHVAQLITRWQDGDKPTKVMAQSAYEWEHYCRQPFTMPADNSDALVHWVPDPDPVTHTSPTSISAWDRREEERQPTQVCYHVMASRASVLVEDIVCGDANTNDQANQIATQAQEVADRLLSNFPQ